MAVKLSNPRGSMLQSQLDRSLLAVCSMSIRLHAERPKFIIYVKCSIPSCRVPKFGRILEHYTSSITKFGYTTFIVMYILIHLPSLDLVSPLIFVINLADISQQLKVQCYQVPRNTNER